MEKPGRENDETIVLSSALYNCVPQICLIGSLFIDEVDFFWFEEHFIENNVMPSLLNQIKKISYANCFPKA